VIRRLTRVAHKIDHAIGRLASIRRVLVELRTPVSKAILSPIYEPLLDTPGLEVYFTSQYPERIVPIVGRDRFLTHREVEWRRFDVYFNADPWARARLRRCAREVHFFHGVAGKYDLDNPKGLPMGYETYDRVAFANRDRMTRYLEAGVVTPRQARLVGYPKLDRLASGRIDGKAVRVALGLDASRRTVIYAPTYSPASSLHNAGESIVRAAARAGWNVIVKLHDRSLDPDPRYSGGIDWRSRMQALEEPGRISYVEQADSSPFLAAADVLITDHSSVGFEYLLLDRPLIVFDVPGLLEAARINPEKMAQLHWAAQVVSSIDCLPQELRTAALAPEAKSRERRRIAAQMFHEPGSATERAVALIAEMLGRQRWQKRATIGNRQPAGRRLAT
jgi:CDP-Glycerol:Poly(glycerophosphate) glycerophosphotransferase